MLNSTDVFVIGAGPAGLAAAIAARQGFRVMVADGAQTTGQFCSHPEGLCGRDWSPSAVGKNGRRDWWRRGAVGRRISPLFLAADGLTPGWGLLTA